MTSEDPRERPTSVPLFGKGTLVALFAWGLIVLAFSAGGLADVTNLWWLVPLFGIAAPLALVAVRGWASDRGAAVDTGRSERELRGALREYGELTLLAPIVVATCIVLFISGHRLGLDKGAGHVAGGHE